MARAHPEWPSLPDVEEGCDDRGCTTCYVQRADFGINFDGDGEYVGLWFDPARVRVDEFAYVSITVEELTALASSDQPTPENRRDTRMTIDRQDLAQALAIVGEDGFGSHVDSDAIIKQAAEEYADLLGSERMVLAHGSPSDGLTLIGPIVPNNPDMEEWIERNLGDDYWWYLPVEAPEWKV